MSTAADQLAAQEEIAQALARQMEGQLAHTPSHQVPGLNATAVLPQDQAGGVSQQR
ncbi:unnamed protein product, partial [Sphacelaria rigidula]